jgi:hypothetical protein
MIDLIKLAGNNRAGSQDYLGTFVMRQKLLPFKIIVSISQHYCDIDVPDMSLGTLRILPLSFITVVKCKKLQEQ